MSFTFCKLSNRLPVSLQKGTQVCWTCSDLGGWLLEQWTCASRCLLLHTIKITAFHAVVQCHNVLLWAFICFHLAVKRRALLELYAQVTVIRKPHHFQKKANNWSCFQQQCDDRDPWLPLLHLCHGLLGKETDPQLLSGCYQHSNKEVAIFSLAVFLLQIISGVACIFCGLLQGQTDPDLKNLQVSFC